MIERVFQQGPWFQASTSTWISTQVMNNGCHFPAGIPRGGGIAHRRDHIEDLDAAYVRTVPDSLVGGSSVTPARPTHVTRTACQTAAPVRRAPGRRGPARSDSDGAARAPRLVARPRATCLWHVRVPVGRWDAKPIL